MSLVVSAFWLDQDTGKSVDFTDWTDGHFMAGVEDARWDLWSSEPVRRRGAIFLPLLAEADLRVEPDELDDFVAEVQRLLVEAEALCAELGPAWEQRRLDHYLHNLLRAADYARVRKGGVTIS